MWLYVFRNMEAGRDPSLVHSYLHPVSTTLFIYTMLRSTFVTLHNHGVNGEARIIRWMN
jgi:hypothetical protein